MLKLLIVIIIGVAFGTTANNFDVAAFSMDGLILGLPWMFILALINYILD